MQGRTPNSGAKSGESTPKPSFAAHKPTGALATPPRAALKGTDMGAFRSVAESTSSMEPAQIKDSVDEHVRLTQQERNRALAHSEWERARIEELGLEIKKLMGAEQVSQAQSDDTKASNSGDERSLASSKSSGLSTSSAVNLPGTMQPRPNADSVLSGLDLNQPLNLYKVPDGIMQVFVIGIHPSNPINRPYVVVRLGDQSFQTSVSKVSTGNWNEGFELIVSYHMQLFGTVHMDVYSNNTLLPDSLVGRAEIKLSLLDGFPEIFTSYYEIWDKKLAASTVPDQRQRSIVSKNLGALQVRVNYRFQKLEDPEPKVARVHGAHISGTVPSQLVNRVASNVANNSTAADMPIDELVAVFVKEYGQNVEMVQKHGVRSIVRSATASDGTKPGVGFMKVDEDNVPPTVDPVNPETLATGAKDGAASSNWFADLFTGAQAAPTADSSTDSTAKVSASGQNTPNDTKSQASTTEASKAASEKTLMQSLTSMFISPSTFMAIKSLERLVRMFNQGVELSNTEMLGGLLTLYKFYNEADIPGVSRPHKGQLVESVHGLELPGRYARFALASYGWRALYFFNRGITLMDGAKVDSDVTSVLQYLNIQPEDLLGYEFRSSQLFCPSYFVAHDRHYKAVVLVVRGTMSAEDTVVDLSCEYTKWNGGLVHSGMKASAQWLFLEVMPQIFAYAGSQDISSIRIVGHSLGASTAAILTIMLQESRSRLAGLGVDINQFNIHAYCYGPAPCVSDNIADRHRDCIDTYVNKDDMVPRLCYGSMSDFKRMSISAADEADNLAQRLYAPFEDSAQQQQRWKERFSRLMSIRQDVLATEENLHLALPGTTYHIVPYRDAGAKKAVPRNVGLEVAIARRQLFGLEGSPAEDSTPGDSGTSTAPQMPPPPPPSTPNIIVQEDSVNPDDLADAINTPIRDSFDPPDNDKADKQQAPRPDIQQGDSTGSVPVNIGSSDKFVPVWVQKVSDKSFREVILRPTIITDHMPSAYELAFAHAIETQVYERQIRDKRKKE
ncbi:hypothetical protein IWW49_001466 [Coemansia sp. RSA 1797]|nr:hypothetical protein IWW49_001466 [Coemansia sp. RSA 1797]